MLIQVRQTTKYNKLSKNYLKNKPKDKENKEQKNKTDMG